MCRNAKVLPVHVLLKPLATSSTRCLNAQCCACAFAISAVPGWTLRQSGKRICGPLPFDHTHVCNCKLFLVCEDIAEVFNQYCEASSDQP